MMRKFQSPLLVLFASLTIVVGALFVLVLTDPLTLGSAQVAAGTTLMIHPHSASPLDHSPSEVEVVWGNTPDTCSGYCPLIPYYWSTWTLAVLNCGEGPCVNGSVYPTVAASSPASGGEVDFEGILGNFYAVHVQNSAFQLNNQTNSSVANIKIPVTANELTPLDGGWPGLGLAVIGLAGLSYAVVWGREPKEPNRFD